MNLLRRIHYATVCSMLYRATIGTNTVYLFVVGGVGDGVEVDVGVVGAVGDGVVEGVGEAVGEGVGVACVDVPPNSTAPMSHTPTRVASIWSSVGQFAPLSINGLPDNGM